MLRYLVLAALAVAVLLGAAGMEVLADPYPHT